MKVILSAAASPVAPSIIKHLQKLGHHVIGHDSSVLGVGSTLVDEFYVSPPAIHGEEYQRFLDWLLPKGDIYLPFLDEELPLLWKPMMSGECHIVMSRPCILDIFTSKIRQQEALEKVELPVAKSAYKPPAIFKPEHSRGGKGIVIAWDNDVFDAMIKKSGFAAQKFIEGTEYTVDILTDLNGKFLFAVPRKRVVASNVSIIGTIEMSQDIIDLAKKVTFAFQFCGPINMQVIRDHSGNLHITEINARLSGSVMFTVLAGFDILDATIGLYTGKRFIPPKVNEITIRRYWQEAIL